VDPVEPDLRKIVCAVSSIRDPERFTEERGLSGPRHYDKFYKISDGRLLAALYGVYPMEVTRMRSIKSLAIIPAAIAACGIVSGCFSYHRTVDETTAPAPVVETVPAPVAVVPAPVVAAPVTTSSTTTTTTDTAPTMVERQRTTTYIPAPY